MSKKEPADSAADNGALGKVTERVSSAYSSARDAASGAVISTTSGIEGNPLAALLGGLALGAVAGVLIPRIAREQELLEPLGARLHEAARAALDAGRKAGTDAFADAGFSTDNLRTQASRLVEQLLGAAGAAGSAAVGAARDAAQG